MKITVTKSATPETADRVHVRFDVPITKVDSEKRTVSGIATGEWTDHHGQIVDYAHAKAAFEKWPGNIREMHQPIAAGRAVGITFDDDAKAISVDSYVSKGAQSTWEKVVDQTLRGYSIGGNGVVKMENRDGGIRPVIYLEEMVELSLVDVGALPGSEISIVKVVDGQPQYVAPVDEPEAIGEPVTITDAGSLRALMASLMKGRKVHVQPDGGMVFDGLITKLADGDRVRVQKYVESYDLYSAMCALQWLQEVVSSEYYEVAYPPDDADQAQNRAQLDLIRAAAKLIIAFLMSEFDAQFAAIDADAAASDTTAVALLRTAAESEAVRKAIGEMPASFSAIDPTGKLVFIGKAGARHSKADVAMIQAMHDTAISLGAACAAIEKMVDVDEAAVVKFLDALPGPAGEALQAVFMKLATPVQKAETPAAAVESPSTGLTVEAVQTMIETAQKGTVEKVTALESTIAEQKATIEKQAAQITALEAQPAPGGPVTRVTPGSTQVEKTIGSVPAAAGEVSPDAMVAAITKLGSDATPTQRQALSELMIKVQHATGHGARAIAMHQADTP